MDNYNFIVISVMFIFLTSCDSGLKKEIDSLKKISSVEDFKSIKTSWDEVFIYAPYTGLDDIKKDLKGYKNNSISTEIELSDKVMLIIFARNKVIVNYTDYPNIGVPYYLNTKGEIINKFLYKDDLSKYKLGVRKSVNIK